MATGNCQPNDARTKGKPVFKSVDIGSSHRVSVTTSARITGAIGLSQSRAATATYTVHSTLHSRERMEQRSITKRDLQRAIKYAGHLAVPGKPSRLSGEPTLLIEYEGIVYCTDSTKKWAITAWRTNEHDENSLLAQPMRVEDDEDLAGGPVS